jgi:hypothetical protein
VVGEFDFPEFFGLDTRFAPLNFLGPQAKALYANA